MTTQLSTPDQPAIGVIAGSGFYQIDGFENAQEFEVETPFGMPSDVIVGGTFVVRDESLVPDARPGKAIRRTKE